MANIQNSLKQNNDNSVIGIIEQIANHTSGLAARMTSELQTPSSSVGNANLVIFRENQNVKSS